MCKLRFARYETSKKSERRKAPITPSVSKKLFQRNLDEGNFCKSLSTQYTAKRNAAYSGGS